MKLWRTPSTRAALLVLLGGSTVMYVLGPAAAGWVRGRVGALFVPFGDVGMAVATSFKAHLAGLNAEEIDPAAVRRLQEDLDVERGRRDALEAQCAALRRHMAQARLFQQELFGGSPDVPCILIPARVVGADSMPYGATRLLNAGTSAGIESGDRVTTRRLYTDRSKRMPNQGWWTVVSNALVGRIIETGPYAARLQLLTDRGFSIHARVRRVHDPKQPRKVRVERRGAARIVPLTEKLAVRELIDVELHGDGRVGLVARNVKAHHAIRPGDRVRMRTDDPKLPAAVPIGTVVEVKPNPDNSLFATLHIRPRADLAALREVYIVCPKGSLDGG